MMDAEPGPAAAARRTLGAVREEELRAGAAELGVQVLAYPDGTLQQHRSSLSAAVAGIMRRFDAGQNSHRSSLGPAPN